MSPGMLTEPLFETVQELHKSVNQPITEVSTRCPRSTRTFDFSEQRFTLRLASLPGVLPLDVGRPFQGGWSSARL